MPSHDHMIPNPTRTVATPDGDVGPAREEPRVASDGVAAESATYQSSSADTTGAPSESDSVDVVRTEAAAVAPERTDAGVAAVPAQAAPVYDAVSSPALGDSPLPAPSDVDETAAFPADSVGTAVPDQPAPAAVPTESGPELAAGLWPAGDAQSLRQRWQDLQLRFVDDPRNVAEEADFLVGEAVDTLTASLASLRADLSSWRSEGGGDTEQLRVAVQRYRQFLNHVLAL